MLETRTHSCRACPAYCPIEVTIDRGKAVKVDGNRRAPLYGGFICPKGRSLPLLHDQPGRLMHSLKRQPNGEYRPIPTDVAIAEIAEKLRTIVDRHGPRSVAAFFGTPAHEQPASAPMILALLRALGSPSIYSMATLDQPGMMIADALHGSWEGGRMRPETLDTFLLVGGNPVVSKQYFSQNPGQRLKEMTRQGMQLIVIDPRKTETARRAAVHLQAIPGEDPTVIAGLINLLIARHGVGTDFVEQNATGLSALMAAVAPFTPDYVAARAGIEEAELITAADIIAHASTGDTGPGTGMSFSTRGSLTSYLLLCLQTLRGFWAHAGQEYNQSGVFLPRAEVRAQPAELRAAMGDIRMRVRGLRQSVAGLPAAAFAEEILTPGEGQIRACFMLASGALSIPQQSLAQEALRDLDLLVTHDVEFSPTARLADYVIATKLQLELPAITYQGEVACKVHHGYGWPVPYAAYQPAAIDPPAGADVIDVWRVYYRLAQQLGLQLTVGGLRSATAAPLDMEREPTTYQVFEALCSGSAVPLSEVAKYPDGHVFDDARIYVQPKDPACTARLRLDDPDMLAELKQVREEDPVQRRGTSEDYPFLLVPRRLQNSTNASQRVRPPLPGVGTNPAFMHPDDLAAVDAASGDPVDIRSRWGEIQVLAEEDPTLRRGVVALTHGFGRNLDELDDPRRHGANVNRLTAVDDDADRWTGLPRMGAIPVSVKRSPPE